MICREFEKYENGEMGEDQFERHAAGCLCCREMLRRDAEIMALTKELRRPVQAPGLWSRIEKALEEEAAKERGRREEVRPAEDSGRLRVPLLARFLRLAPAAALILAAAGLALYFGLRKHPPSSPSGILSRSALARVERTEKEYLKAIEALEKQAQPEMAGLDLELIFLYRDRLETVDAQIKRCREALESNPANAHIRRYLMAALHDKRETLAEVLNLKAGKTEGT
jgi:tetratricopeptide (TPR) repeat protein